MNGPKIQFLKDGELPTILAPVLGSGSSVASRYAWRDENRLKHFASWEEEIAHMESLGFKLVPPEYRIPNWRVKMRMGEAIPTLYVLRNDGPDKFSANFDRYAAELGYPVFYRTNPERSGGTSAAALGSAE